MLVGDTYYYTSTQNGEINTFFLDFGLKNVEYVKYYEVLEDH